MDKIKRFKYKRRRSEANHHFHPKQSAGNASGKKATQNTQTPS